MDQFDYDLPAERIAQVPAEPRDSARLLVDRGPLRPAAHRLVRDLPAELVPGDVVVVNETRVLPARLRMRKDTGGSAEVLLLQPCGPPGMWLALVRPGRRLRPGTTLRPDLSAPNHGPRARHGDVGRAAAAESRPGADLEVVVGESRAGGVRLVEVTLGSVPVDAATAESALAGIGDVPLPPYIHTGLADTERYQTVYARRAASVAAPTAGLHLTAPLLERMAERGASVVALDLVVGLDTFRPVTVDDPADHAIHSEWYSVPEATWAACRSAQRVVAIGTTTVRALESAARRGALEGTTDIFIREPFEFAVVDVLLTNFHLPRSTLLLLVDAFVGPRWRRLYEQALAGGYRFLSFGDAMLLRRS